MKKCALQIVSLCIAMFIAYISGGLNIYHYCCDACEELNQFTMHNAQFIIVNAQSTTSHECCAHHNLEEEVADWGNDKIHSNTSCGITHIEAPDFSHLNKKSVNFVAPLIATHITIHNSQFIIHNHEYEALDYDIPIVHNLTGRAIIVLKSAYLI